MYTPPQWLNSWKECRARKWRNDACHVESFLDDSWCSTWARCAWRMSMHWAQWASRCAIVVVCDRCWTAVNAPWCICRCRWTPDVAAFACHVLRMLADIERCSMRIVSMSVVHRGVPVWAASQQVVASSGGRWAVAARHQWMLDGGCVCPLCGTEVAGSPRTA